MRSSSQGNFCQIHNEQFVAIDIHPSNVENYRHCCVKCVQNKCSQSNILIYSDAKKYVSKQKKAFLYDKETQIKRNKELMKQLIAKILTIKSDYNKILNQLEEFINSQIIQADQEIFLIQKRLEEIDIDQYLSKKNEFADPENNSKGLKFIIERKLEEIQNLNFITQCQEIVGVFDIRLLQLNPQMPITLTQRTKDEKIEFNLNFKCPVHNSEIRMFDLNENISKESRLACEDCISGKQGQYIKLSKVYEQWQEYNRQSCLLLNESQTKVNSKIVPLITYLKQYRDDHQNRITTMILELKQLQDKLQKDKEVKIEKQSTKWHLLVYNDVLDLAETLSQPNYIKKVQQQEENQNYQIVCSINKIIKKGQIEKTLIESQYQDQLNKLGQYSSLQICSETVKFLAYDQKNYRQIDEETTSKNEDMSLQIDKIPQKQCFIHNEDCIAIDINPECYEEKRHCCAKCLMIQKKDQKIMTYKDAQTYLHQQKTQFKEQKESQLKQNYDALKIFEQSILNFKDQMNAICLKLLDQSATEAKKIQLIKAQLGQKLSLITIDSYLSGNNEFAKQNDSELKKFQTTILKSFPSGGSIEFKYSFVVNPNNPIILAPEKLQLESSFSLICSEHQQEIIMVDLNETVPMEKRLICQVCFKQKKGNFTSVEEFKQKWEEYEKMCSNHLSENIEKFHSKIDPLQLFMSIYEGEIRDRIFKFLKKILERRYKIENRLYKQIENHRIREWSKINFNQVSNILEILIQPNYIQKMQIDQIKELDSLTDYIEKELKTVLQAKEHAESYFTKQLSQLSFNCQLDELIMNHDKYEETFQVLNKNEECGAIALSQNKDILVAGCKQLINVYKFNQGKIVLKQQLRQHKFAITNLCFMKSNEQFVSIDENGSLAIWILVTPNWYVEQYFDPIHCNKVQCLLINSVNNQIITGSSDKSIKFFIKKYQWFLAQNLQIHEGQVLDMSLNSNQNRLVSCGYVKPGFFFKSEGQLIISESDGQVEWKVIQKIKSDNKVNRVCFIRNNQIIYQTKFNIILLVEKQKNYFECQRKILNTNDDSSIFPLAFNMTKSWLIFKNINTISVLKMTENNENQYKQMIILQSDYSIGTLSFDGEYLIIWDSQSKLLQVRRCQL